MPEPIEITAIVIGAGISGVATLKCMREAGFDCIALERTGDVGGLWAFKEKAYGVMKFTHINVSKHNYCFSDFPFPDEATDFPHNSEMEAYIRSYVKNFDLEKNIRFHTQVNLLVRDGEKWRLETESVVEDDKGIITTTGKKQTYVAKYVAIATGHHAKPSYPQFAGIETFKGKAYHSVDFNDSIDNGLSGKRVVVVGIGNSAVDVACNAAAVARCKPVHISTRSGAWVMPNYVFGSPVDHYACRLFMMLPWKLANVVVEGIVKVLTGNPKKWKLNPKMHVMQTQPTVSPTLIHHIQRGEVKVVPNIQRIDGDQVTFTDGTSVGADHLIMCTGYKISLPFISSQLAESVVSEDSNDLKLYKNVFSPDLDHTLSFIGFVQPASGGLLTMSEIQGRWWAELCKGKVSLPGRQDMIDNMQEELAAVRSRYYASSRHTIQRDPIVYNDEIAAFIGAKPEYKKNPLLAWRLLLGSCGAYQWRLQGPHHWTGASNAVKKVPVTEMMTYGVPITVLVLGYLLYVLLRLVFGSIGL